MKEKVKIFRDGVFSLHTRRFGTVAELIMLEKYSLSGNTKNQHHDATDKDGKRIEIKFSRVLKENPFTINKHNLLKQTVESSTGSRAVKSKDMYDTKFDCNIQQIKREEFDRLLYGLFFADKIAIFELSNKEVMKVQGYSDFQHKGNKGEGQFHVNNDSIDYHMKTHFKEWITYEDVINMFNKYSKDE